MSTVLRLSLAEYDQIIRSDAFQFLDRRIELLNGVLTETSPAGPIHSDYVAYLMKWSFNAINPEITSVRCQSGIDFPELDSRPEPDIVWVAAGRYLSSHPQSDDVRLLIEVSDSSLQSDKEEKALLYAKAAIVEYWLVDIPHQQIIVHIGPSATGYKSIRAVQQHEMLKPQHVVSRCSLNLNELFADS